MKDDSLRTVEEKKGAGAALTKEIKVLQEFTGLPFEEMEGDADGVHAVVSCHKMFEIVARYAFHSPDEKPDDPESIFSNFYFLEQGDSSAKKIVVTLPEINKKDNVFKKLTMQLPSRPKQFEALYRVFSLNFEENFKSLNDKYLVNFEKKTEKISLSKFINEVEVLHNLIIHLLFLPGLTSKLQSILANKIAISLPLDKSTYGIITEDLIDKIPLNSTVISVSPPGIFTDAALRKLYHREDIHVIIDDLKSELQRIHQIIGNPDPLRRHFLMDEKAVASTECQNAMTSAAIEKGISLLIN